jgi:ABC-2 type transport system permease protein
MAVYKRTYHGYAGPITPTWSRFLILYRYSKQNLFRSKLQTVCFVMSFFFPLLCLLAIYLTHNLSFLKKYNLDPNRLLAIDNKFFFIFVVVQGWLAFILTAFSGPGLISPDLANGALPLYFCRPFSRAEYILGKIAALTIFLSLITWVPGLLLFAVQGALAGPTWLWGNVWMAGSILLSCWIWIAILAVLATALSAWVRWKILAGSLLLGIFFIGAGFGEAINAVMRTKAGDLVNVLKLVSAVWVDLFRMDDNLQIPVPKAWTGLLLICGVCLFLLWRKVRAFEVVK